MVELQNFLLSWAGAVVVAMAVTNPAITVPAIIGAFIGVSIGYTLMHIMGIDT